MKLLNNHSLKSYNTFGIETYAKYFAEVFLVEDLQQLLQMTTVKNNPLLVLGGGSNILLRDDFEGVVIKNSIKGYEAVNEDDKYTWIKVGGGEDWHQLVLRSIEENLGGLENLSLIPGTVGASPMQNIGAYGVEIKDVFDQLQAVKIEDGTLHTFNHQDCEFDYRSSIFKTSLKNQFIISSVTLRLTKKQHLLKIDYGAIKQTLESKNIAEPTIKDISNAVVAIRQSKLPDPAKIGNSGSFFKNPIISASAFDQLQMQYKDMPGYKIDQDQVKVPAAWLIEQCGWKGHTRNNHGVHKNHALVLVNYGGANGEDIWQLAKSIQKSVSEKFGIEIHPEVNLVG